MDWKDVWIRTAKTFAQAFGGILIPELVVLLSGALPDTIEAWKVALLPVACSALAAGISAAWNIILQKLKEEEK